MGCLQHGKSALRRLIGEAPHMNNCSSSSNGALNPLFYACQGVRYRSVEVILTTKIDKLGKAGETVKVAPGYFRNHLMPKFLAVPNIDKYAHLLREQQKIYPPKVDEEPEVQLVDDEEKNMMRQYIAAARRLDKNKLTIRTSINKKEFRARATKDEPIKILEPVTSDNIIKEVARQFNVLIDPENVQLPSPLTTFGEFEVPLRMPKDIPLPEGKLSWTLKVKIRGK